MKKKLYDVLVIGTGLSSLAFIDSYLERNSHINVISFKKNPKIGNRLENKHIFKILPPQMIGEEKQVHNYFNFNKVIINPKNNFFGALEFGGLSNYWGLQIDKNILGDISYLTKKTQIKIYRSFIEIFKKLNLIGKLNSSVKNNYKKNEYIGEDFFKNNKDLFFDEPILAYQKKSKKLIQLKSLTEKKDKLTPINFYNKYLKRKKIKFHNYFVESIKDDKIGVQIFCSNGKEKKIFSTKKLVLGCGTLITTKLIMDYLNISKEVKINHILDYSLLLFKKRWKYNGF